MADLSKLIVPEAGKKLTPRFVYQTAQPSFYTSEPTKEMDGRWVCLYPKDLLDVLSHRTLSACMVSSENFGLVDLGVKYAIQRLWAMTQPRGGESLSTVERWEQKASNQLGSPARVMFSASIRPVKDAKHENYHIWIYNAGSAADENGRALIFDGY